MNLCPLCNSPSKSFYKEQYCQCDNCAGIFRPKELLPTLQEEQQRYDTHNNDVEDIRYQNFVSPITNAIIANQKKSDSGLDLGAGPGPVIANILIGKGYDIKLYDPIYHNFPELLKQKYDYIFACEVIEHFHNPKDEFARLYDILNTAGRIYCMTHLYDDSIDFSKWYYKNDNTHVFIYRKETIEWIAEEFKFTKMQINNRLIVFEK